jgi:hypothetical protein
MRGQPNAEQRVLPQFINLPNAPSVVGRWMVEPVKRRVNFWLGPRAYVYGKVIAHTRLSER